MPGFPVSFDTASFLLGLLLGLVAVGLTAAVLVRGRLNEAREAGRQAKSVADRLGCIARFWNVRRLSTQAGSVANSGSRW